MRIGVVSDTHMPRMARDLPEPLRRGLAGVDLILHAGDFVTELAVEALERVAPVIGVAGNNDDAGIRRRFPARQVIEHAGFRIGLVHGHEGRRRTTPERALEAFEGERLALVVFGHSHIPLLDERDGVRLFNPGSPTDKRRQSRFSFGILELGAHLEARHEFYDRKRAEMPK
ncbi:MAG: YfcE family phosphodiesterase [Dehalococcoidia bacterium]|nr:YfcE family phosphodiesterase [Dehalococcoidia bacterium]